jgi:hypothetical protein
MKKAVVIGILVGVPAMADHSALAQDVLTEGDADYEGHFGQYDYGGEEEQKPRDDGPRSLAEAKAQHRGYRIGGGGMHKATGGAEVHVVREGDTLWDISDSYFGDPWHWPQLWSFNPEITNPHWIYPLDQVRLSPSALAGDEMIAKVQGGDGTTGIGSRAPSAGVLAGTETAPSVIVPKGAFTPGTVFLREQGYLDQEALRGAGVITGGNEEQMFLAPSDQVYVKFKSDEPVRDGQVYTVFRQMKPEERSAEEQGVLVKILGTVVVRSYDKDKRIARGIVTEAMDPIERGMFVARIDRRFDLVAPKRNTSNVVAHIIANIEPRTLMGYGEVVFLDVGQGKGIEPGNRFFVVRRGDGWMESIDVNPTEVGNVTEVPEYDQAVLPKEVVAELRVLKVRKNTTVAVIVRADTDLALGDRAEMRAGF